MRIAIVEDFSEDAARLQEFLECFGDRQQVLIQTEVFLSGEEFLEKFKKGRYDLIFMDIYLGGMNGIETATEVRRTDTACLLVLLSSSADFTWQAFPVRCFDYILKPFEETKVESLMQDVLRTVDRVSRYVELSCGRQKLCLTFSDIICAVADDHHTVVTTKSSGDLRCYIFYSALCEELGTDSRFLECNRGIVINMDYVKKLNQDHFVMENSASYPIRRRDRVALSRRFSEYIFQKTRGDI